MTLLINEIVERIQHQIDDGKVRQASALVDAALLEHPSAPQLLLAKISVLLEEREYAEALPRCIQAVKIMSHDPRAWTLLCRALQHLGFIDLSLRMQEQALRHVVPDLDLLRFRGDTLYEGRHFTTAIAAYQPVLERYGEQPEVWRVWYNYSDCLSWLGKAQASDEADQWGLRCLRKLFETGRVTSQKQLASLWFHEGKLYARLKEWRLAERSFAHSISADWSAGGIFWLYTIFRMQRRGLMVALTFPFALTYSIPQAIHESFERSSIIEQRASISPTLLSQLEALITQ